MLTFLASTAAFLLLHLAVRHRSDRAFHVDLKLSRGIASVVLTLVGAVFLAVYLPLWRQAFLAFHEPGSPPQQVVSLLAGHLLADLLWLAYGRLAAGSIPRRDLIIHHLGGLAACGITIYFGLGYLLIAVAMTTEMMPVATGLGAWGKVVDSPRLQHAALRLGLGALVFWRIPLWIFIFTMVATGRPRAFVDAPPSIYPIALVVLAGLIALDLYWIAEARSSLVRFTERPRREALSPR